MERPVEGFSGRPGDHWSHETGHPAHLPGRSHELTLDELDVPEVTAEAAQDLPLAGVVDAGSGVGQVPGSDLLRRQPFLEGVADTEVGPQGECPRTLESPAERCEDMRLDRSPAGREDVEGPGARPQHAGDLADRLIVGHDMLEDRSRIAEVKGA